MYVYLDSTQPQFLFNGASKVTYVYSHLGQKIKDDEKEITQFFIEIYSLSIFGFTRFVVICF